MRPVVNGDGNNNFHNASRNALGEKKTEKYFLTETIVQNKIIQ